MSWLVVGLRTAFGASSLIARIPPKTSRTCQVSKDWMKSRHSCDLKASSPHERGGNCRTEPSSAVAEILFARVQIYMSVSNFQQGWQQQKESRCSPQRASTFFISTSEMSRASLTRPVPGQLNSRCVRTSITTTEESANRSGVTWRGGGMKGRS